MSHSTCEQDEGAWVTLMDVVVPGGNLMEFVVPKVYSKRRLAW